MSDHVVAIVQTRLNSTRLKRKALVDIAGRPMILHVLERAAAIQNVHTVAAAIPMGEEELGAVIREAGFAVFEGPAEDVLKRYVLAAEALAADVIVRITGDCPLLDPDVGTSLVAHTLQHPYGYYTSACAADGSIDGLDIEVLRRWILEAADREATELLDREHVTLWMRRNVLSVPHKPNHNALKVSVDTVDDLLRVRQIFEHLPAKQFSSAATLIAAARATVWDFPHDVR